MFMNIDELVKSRKTPFFVIPAKAGIQFFNWLQSFWTPVFTGVTTFYETINITIHIYFSVNRHRAMSVPL